MIVLAVFDAAVGAFARPIFVPSQGLGIRVFMDEVGRKAADNPMQAHPQDFSLFRLGEFDEKSGMFESLAVPERVAQAIDFHTGD
ncbi:MAG: nonstructural protein [Microvirus sp.]|nr:MAG: nonstructural protein [Microvirus sp.]